MLSRREKIIMKYIYTKCANKKSTLISLNEFLEVSSPNEMKEVELNEILNNLVLENYISLIPSEKNKVKTYCISLKEKGESFQRELDNNKKSIAKAITRTVLLACLSFIVGLILKAIFT